MSSHLEYELLKLIPSGPTAALNISKLQIQIQDDTILFIMTYQQYLKLDIWNLCCGSMPMPPHKLEKLLPVVLKEKVIMPMNFRLFVIHNMRGQNQIKTIDLLCVSNCLIILLCCDLKNYVAMLSIFSISIFYLIPKIRKLHYY